jgi:hypothetical protein
MNLNPLDIACYIYCPVLQEKGNTEKVANHLTFLEENLRNAFIDAERNACIKDSIVTPRKLLSSWDKIWWPAVAANGGISMKEANKLSLTASSKFADYCKYDISDWMFPTAGVKAESQIKINRSILKATADVIKVDLNGEKNTILINFNRKNLSLRGAAHDPAIKTIAYAFYSGKGETITHIAIDLDETSNKIKMITSTFRPEDMEGIRKMLYHVESGISSGIPYVNPYMCKECKLCQDFIL